MVKNVSYRRKAGSKFRNNCKKVLDGKPPMEVKKATLLKRGREADAIEGREAVQAKRMLSDDRCQRKLFLVLSIGRH